MSLADSTTRPDGLSQFAHRAAAWRGRTSFERLSRSPGAALPIGKGRKMTIHVDRVRAKPAVSPSLSMNIGMNAAGLGVWGFFFPRHVKKTLGIEAPTSVVQAVFGARELWSGYSLAGDPTRNGVLWARVAGDVFDILALKALYRPSNPKRGNARAALGFVLAVTALDVIAAIRMTNVKRTCE